VRKWHRQATLAVNGARLGVSSCIALADLLQMPNPDVLRAYEYTTEADTLERGSRRLGHVPAAHAVAHDALEQLEPEAFEVVANTIRVFHQLQDRGRLRVKR
jgi:hypothetical protein